MEFSNTANGQGIIQDVDFLCGSTSGSYPVNDKVRNINQAYHDITRLIWECVDDWQYDDSNKTTLPVAYTTLVDGQKDYEIPSDAQKIRRIEVKNSAGDWIKLTPIDYRDINEALPENLETNGMPIYYDLVGRSIMLYPTVSDDYVTLASGMAAYVDRDVDLFTSASTTATPGFAPQFHRLLSIDAALNFEKDVNQQKLLIEMKRDLTSGLKRFYNSREVERRAELRPATKNYQRQYE
jgi:hypothetical protein